MIGVFDVESHGLCDLGGFGELLVVFAAKGAMPVVVAVVEIENFVYGTEDSTSELPMLPKLAVPPRQ